MRIGASPIQTALHGSIQGQDALRQSPVPSAARGELDKARIQDAPNRPESRVQISDDARRVAQQQEVVPAGQAAKAQRNYQYYPFPDKSGLSTAQQKALQTYSNNQYLSRSDNSGDFLGSIDVFA